MPSCRTTKNPKGFEITFTEADHKYRTRGIDGEIIDYISGTTLVSNYFPKFDPNLSIAKSCAKKDGVSLEEIQEKWAKAGKEACDFGTKVHECCEDVFLNIPKENFRNRPSDMKSTLTFKNAIDISKKLINKLDILGVEQIVFSKDLRIAGTIDLLGKIKNKDIYVIIDHKTNKTITKENSYNKYALSPIVDIPDNNFGHYMVQLNLYEFLLKFENYVPKDAKFKLLLNHITQEKASLIPIPNIQEQIKDIIIDYLLKSFKTV